MDSATVCEVVDCIGRLFDHIPYAVCGTAALIYYGYESYFPDHVSITCPEESKEAIRCWALAKGMSHSPGNPDGFSVRTMDGRLFPVCIKFMKSGFEALETARVGPARASVVTLPSIANTIARSYVFRLHNASTERQALYARYLTWTLKCMAQVSWTEPAQRLTPWNAKDIVNRSFWIPFTLCYPETVPLFAAAGLEIQEDGPIAWHAEEEFVTPMRSRSQRSSHRYSFNMDSDLSESESTPPSLRRVTKRLPGVRPLLNTGFSSPATSDSEFSNGEAPSPQFILASPLTSPTHHGFPPAFPAYHHHLPPSPSDSRRQLPMMPPPLPRKSISNANEPRIWI